MVCSRLNSSPTTLQKSSLSVIPEPVQTSSLSWKALLRSIAGFILLSVLFAMAYSQSPLYTSNQNQYLLHGLAAAGVGHLDQDWLAGTLDPTPLFSKLVELTIRITHLDSLFYLFYALLMGVYVVSMAGIADLLFNLRSSRTKSLIFMAAFTGIHSAGLRFALSRWLGSNWTYALEDGVADQRMLGPVLQPSAFGVFLALSLYLFLRRRHYLAATTVAIAVAFHPTYLLGAALLVLAYLWSEWREGKSLAWLLGMGLLALVLVSPILYYVYTSFSGSSPETTAQARQILANYRIPHHALASQWLDATAWFKLGLIAAAIVLAFRLGKANLVGPVSTRLANVMLIISLLAGLLTLFQVVSGNTALALLFPWRISILLVPLATTLLLAFLVDRLWTSILARSVRNQHLANLLSTLVIFFALLLGGMRFVLDLQRKALAPERPLEAYVAEHQSAGEIYLIPIKMQDFRLETGASAYIEFKSIPYRDTDVLEWRRRIRQADRFYDQGDCTILEQLSGQEGVSHVVLPAEAASPTCYGLDVIYQDQAFRLARLK